MKQLEEVWKYVVNSIHLMDADLTKRYHVAVKATKEKYDLNDDFIKTLANVAAYYWK